MSLVKTYRDYNTEDLLVSLANVLAAKEVMLGKGYVVLADTLEICIHGIEHELAVRGFTRLLKRVKGQHYTPRLGVECIA